MLNKTFQQRCEEECTRDVIFLLQRRYRPSREDGYWIVDSVWLDRDEAEKYASRRDYHYGKHGVDWQVYGVPANGALAAFLALQDTLDSELEELVVQHAGRDYVPR